MASCLNRLIYLFFAPFDQRFSKASRSRGSKKKQNKTWPVASQFCDITKGWNSGFSAHHPKTVSSHKKIASRLFFVVGSSPAGAETSLWKSAVSQISKFAIHIFCFADLLCWQVQERTEGKAEAIQCICPLKLRVQMQLSGAAASP